MVLRSVIKVLDEVEEAFRPLYKSVGDLFVLDLSDDEIKLHPGTKSLQAAMRHAKDEREAAREEVKKLKADFEKFKDIDPEKAREALKKIEELSDKELIDAGQIEELVGQKTERMRADFDGQLVAKTEALTHANEQLATLGIEISDIKIFSTIRDAAVKAGARPEALDDIVNRGRAVWKLVEGSPRAYKVGTEDVLYGKEGEVMGIDEWVGTLAKDAEHLFRESGGGGAKGGDGANIVRDGVKVVPLSESGGHLADIANGTTQIAD